MKCLRGFTLIELLIVVAIIAILAAIAVPNFLEAQVRAKTAKAKSDMRTLAIGLEAYRVDNSDYPPHVRPPGQYNLVSRVSILTTPLAYLTLIPMDPFNHRGTLAYWSHAQDTYDYFDHNNPGHPYLWTLFGRKWRLTSAGPDFIATWATMPPYDATNGTKSEGDIVLLQGMTDYNYLPLLLKFRQ